MADGEVAGDRGVELARHIAHLQQLPEQEFYEAARKCGFVVSKGEVMMP